MYDSIFMDIFYTHCNLMHIILGFYLCYSLPSLDEFVQSLIRAKLQYNIYVLLIFEKVMESYDILRLQRSMYLYL